MLRKPTGKRGLWIALALATAAGTAGCGSVAKPVSPPPPPPTEIAVGIASEPLTLNPIFAEDRSSLAVSHALFDSVESEGPGGALQPELAQQVTVGDGGRTYVIRLRPDVKWHDGQPLKAEDVVFTYLAVTDPQVDSPYRSLFLVDGKPPEIRAVDDLTVEIRLPRPSASFVNALTIGILPKHVFSKPEDVKNPRFNNNPVGTGPFRFQQWKSGQSIELKRFDDYFGGKPGVDKLIFRIIPESGMRSAFADGNIDVFAPSPADVLKLRSDQKASGSVNLLRFDSGAVLTLLFHVKGSPAADAAVRRALSLAVDRAEIARSGFGAPDLATPAVSLFPPGNWAHTSGTAPAPDPERAKKILDEAGWLAGPSGVRVKNGRTLTLQLLYIGDRTTERIAELLANQAAAVGIQIQPKGVDRASFYQILGAEHKNFDLALNLYLLGPDPDAFADLVTSRGEYNFQEYDNPEVDQLFRQAREVLEQSARQAAYRRVDEWLARDVPVLPLVYPTGFLAVRTSIVHTEQAEPWKVVFFRHPERLAVNPSPTAGNR